MKLAGQIGALIAIILLLGVIVISMIIIVFVRYDAGPQLFADSELGTVVESITIFVPSNWKIEYVRKSISLEWD